MAGPPTNESSTYTPIQVAYTEWNNAERTYTGVIAKELTNKRGIQICLSLSLWMQDNIYCKIPRKRPPKIQR